MKKIECREMQESTINKFFANLKKGLNDQLIIAGMGYGKTIVFFKILEQLFEMGRIENAIVLAHTGLLIRDLNDRAKLIVNKEYIDKIYIQTRQTFIKEVANTTDKIDALIIDEAHHICCPEYVEIIKHLRDINPNIIILGVTATPDRADALNVLSILPTLTDTISLKRMVVNKLASPSMIIHTPIYITKQIYNQIIKHYLEFRSDKKLLTIGFAETIKECEHLSAIFNKHGIASDFIHSNLNEAEVDKKKNMLANREIEVLFNVSILTEGIDIPEINCILLCKKYLTQTALLQASGRGSRLAKNKSVYYIIDYRGSLNEYNRLEEIEPKPIFDDSLYVKERVIVGVDVSKKAFKDKTASGICFKCGYVLDSDDVCMRCFSYMLPKQHKCSGNPDEFNRVFDLRNVKPDDTCIPLNFHDFGRGLYAFSLIVDRKPIVYMILTLNKRTVWFKVEQPNPHDLEERANKVRMVIIPNRPSYIIGLMNKMLQENIFSEDLQSLHTKKRVPNRDAIPDELRGYPHITSGYNHVYRAHPAKVNACAKKVSGVIKLLVDCL